MLSVACEVGTLYEQKFSKSTRYRPDHIFLIRRRFSYYFLPVYVFKNTQLIRGGGKKFGEM